MSDKKKRKGKKKDTNTEVKYEDVDVETKLAESPNKNEKDDNEDNLEKLDLVEEVLDTTKTNSESPINENEDVNKEKFKRSDYQRSKTEKVDRIDLKPKNSDFNISSLSATHEPLLPRRAQTRDLPSHGDRMCRVHNLPSIGINSKTFKLQCKNCVFDIKSLEQNLGNFKAEAFTLDLNEPDPSPIEQIEEKEKEEENNDFCPNHPKEKIIFYCEDCKELLCKICFHQHRTHNTSMPDIIRERLHLSMIDIVEKLKSMKPQVDEGIKDINDINNQIKIHTTTSNNQLTALNQNLDKILKERLKINFNEFVANFESVDNDVEEAFLRLTGVQKKCNRLILEIIEIESRIKGINTSVNICEYIKSVSSTFVDAKRTITDMQNFLGSKIQLLKQRGDSDLKRFLNLAKESLKKEKIYEKSVVNAALTGATSQSLRLRRFFKYTIDDLSYFRTSTVFMKVNKTICVSGVGICGLLKSTKTDKSSQDRTLSINITVNEIENGQLSKTLVSDNANLKSIVNSYDPVICVYFSKILVLKENISYAITCSNLETSNQYVEIWRGKVYIPSKSNQTVQDVKCSNTRIDFQFSAAKGVQSDFNEFNLGIISDVMYSSIN